MSVLEALLLGILQGLTEFLPVSSTAHLTLAGRVFGLVPEDHPERWTAFLAVVQVGTLVAVLAYFGRDLLAMAGGFFRALAARVRGRPVAARDAASERLAWLVAAGTVPIVVAGLLLRDAIEGPFTKDLRVIAGGLVGLGLLLWVADRAGAQARDLDRLSWRDAAIVGAAQVLSLIPGSSRSGTTLTGGLFSGLTREAAARYSFLLSIPAIAGSAALQLPGALGHAGGNLVSLSVAVLAAAAVGYASIWGLLRYLRRNRSDVFVAWRLALGGAVIALVAAGIVEPR